MSYKTILWGHKPLTYTTAALRGHKRFTRKTEVFCGTQRSYVGFSILTCATDVSRVSDALHGLQMSSYVGYRHLTHGPPDGLIVTQRPNNGPEWLTWATKVGQRDVM